MTQGYDRLVEGPRTRIDRAKLTPTERQELRSISVTTRQSSKSPGTYTTVYYLADDEQAAAKRFVEENRALLDQIDFSKKRNTVQSSVSRDIYDLLLHELGVREIEKYDTVVLETRQDGTQWVIGRRKYDDHPNARYRPNTDHSARVPPECSLTEFFFQSDAPITETDVANSAVEFDGRQVLDYFRVAEGYPCQPTTTADGQLAVAKLTGPATLVTEAAFARTYRTYDDPWETVTDYRAVQSLTDREPESGHGAIADRVGINTSTVRGWLDDGKTPAVINGMERARAIGWLDLDTSASAFAGWNVLVAWIFSGGGISQATFSPSFSIETDRQRRILARALDTVGVDFRVIRETERERATEARPAEAATILGRVLFVLGAPVGTKAANKEIRLPAYLHRVSSALRLDFAQTYLLNRGTPFSESGRSTGVELSEPRSVRYLKELVGFLRATSSEPVELDTANQKLYVSYAAVRAITGDTPASDIFVEEFDTT